RVTGVATDHAARTGLYGRGRDARLLRPEQHEHGPGRDGQDPPGELGAVRARQRGVGEYEVGRRGRELGQRLPGGDRGPDVRAESEPGRRGRDGLRRNRGPYAYE